VNLIQEKKGKKKDRMWAMVSMSIQGKENKKQK